MKLKILSTVYRVLKKKNLMKKEKCCGKIDFSDNTIHYDSDMGPEQTQDTILHECLHSIEYQLGYDFPEKMIVQYTTALIQFMKDNKKFIRSIIE